jgi:hypothetical protein
MKTNLIFKVLLWILVLFSCGKIVSAQGFRGIVPLKSDCADVKRILGVKKCTVPQSVFLLKDFWITVNFTTNNPLEKAKKCYKVPVGRVISFTVTYNKPFPIKDFEYELKYAKGPFGDVNTIAYENKEKGVSVLTNLGRINTAIFVPTPEQYKQFAYRCKSIQKQTMSNDN